MYLYILSVLVSFQRLELQCITQDLLQTSVNLRGDEVVYSVCGLIQSCPVMPTNCSIKFKHTLMKFIHVSKIRTVDLCLQIS